MKHTARSLASQTTVEAPATKAADSAGGSGGTSPALVSPAAAAGAAASDAAPAEAGSPGQEEGKHPPRLLQLLAQQLGLDSPDEIVDFELNVCDTQPGTIGGVPPAPSQSFNQCM